MTYTEDDLRTALRGFEKLAPDIAINDSPALPEKRGWLVPLASIAAGVLLIAAITLASVLVSRHRSAAPAGTNSASQTTAFDGLVLRHPSAWRYAPVTWNSTGPSGPVGFLTDATIGQECDAAGCGAPVKTLGRDQVLITVSATAFGFPLPAKANTSVAGLPALDRQPPSPLACPAGTRVDDTVEIAVPFLGSTSIQRDMSITACFSGPDTVPATNAFQHLLHTATYTYPASGNAAIHGTVTIRGATASQRADSYVNGNLLVYTNPAHTGTGEFNSALSKGSFNVGIGPGTYYLEITRPNRSPCDLGPVIVTSNHDVNADIPCSPN